MLKVNDIHVYYGKVSALQGISLEVRTGELVALIGSNGAGKTTLLKTISGILKPREGTIHFEGQAVTGLSSHLLVQRGISLVPEGREIFPKMTVYENMEMGFSAKGTKQEFEQRLTQAVELFPIIKERYKQQAGTLSGGQQQMLAIARGLMAGPKLLMLDEPSLGLAPIIVQQLAEIIRNLNKQGLTILLVEQNAALSLELSKRAYVLETGKIALEGSGKELLTNEKVKESYLGI